MSVIEQLNTLLKACPEPWAMQKCNCGCDVCRSYFLNFTRSDGRMEEHEAHLIVLMKQTLPLLLDAVAMVAKLEEHLDCTGWGDSYERECSQELRKELEAFNGRLT